MTLSDMITNENVTTHAVADIYVTVRFTRSLNVAQVEPTKKGFTVEYEVEDSNMNMKQGKKNFRNIEAVNTFIDELVNHDAA